jgi:hypothetical protein
MTSFRIRPKFEVSLAKTSEETVRIILDGLKSANHPFDAVEFPGNLIIRCKKENQHYWSPQLNLMFDDDHSGCLIKGRYEPHPNVWTLFILLYLAIAILVLFVSILGFTRISLGMEAKVLWILPVLGAMAFGMYLVSQVGQKLGAEETFDIHYFVEKCLGIKIHII